MENEEEKRRRLYEEDVNNSAFRAQQARKAPADLSLLRGGGDTGVNLMGPASPLTEEDLRAQGIAGLASAVEPPPETEDQRVARRAGEIEAQLAALPANENGETGPMPALGAPADDPLKALGDATQTDPAAAEAQRQRLEAAAKAVGPTTHSSTTESYAKPTVAEAIARGNAATAADSEIDVSRRAKEFAVGSAREEAGAARVEADQLKAAAARAEAQRQQARRAYEDAQGYLAKERERVTKANTTSYWEDKGTGTKVLAALMVGINEFATRLAGKGGTNTALQIINKAVDDDARLKERRLRAELDQLGIKGAEAAERFQYGLVEIQNAKAGLLDRLIQERAVRLAKKGVGEAEIKADAITAGLESRKAATELGIEQSLRHHVQRTTTSDNSLQQQIRLQAATAGTASPDKSIADAKDPERNADKYTQRAVSELQRLKQTKPYAEPDMRKIEAWRARLAAETSQTTVEKFLGNLHAVNGDLLKRLSPDGRKRFLAEQALAESILRPDSGAAISAPEYIDKISGFQASRGDTPESLQQKADRAVTAVASIAGQSYRPGYWYQQLRGVSAGAAKLQPAQIASLVRLTKERPGTPEAAEAEALIRAQAGR